MTIIPQLSRQDILRQAQHWLSLCHTRLTLRDALLHILDPWFARQPRPKLPGMTTARRRLLHD